MTPPAPEAVAVPVDGGTLRVYRWGHQGPPVLAVHGIAASAEAFRALGERLGGALTLLAVDLRGRGASAGLPGPYGLAAHARDLVAVLDHLGVEQGTAVGHSMGAYAVGRLALDVPDRVARLVFIDGGLPLPLPEHADPDEALAAILGPVLQRLRRTFSSRDAYRAYWREHPAFREPGVWNRYVESYADYDLQGDAPHLRSRVSEDAVRVDGREVLSSQRLVASLGELACPVLLLRAARGLLNQPEPLLPDEVVARYRGVLAGLTDRVVDGTNHYTITLGERGADVVAEHIRAAVGVA